MFGNVLKNLLCTPVDNNGQAWCATSVKPSLEYANYGNCEDSYADDSRNWCATSLYGSGGVKDYGYCPESCDEENSIPSDCIPWCATRVEANLNYVEYG
ncbi:Matrix metallopeptidase 9 (Gelatinase B_ 92kDa gelatinase_ 92kDa type IV collagenase) simum, partial [Caligus rogercresseyi]